MITLSLFWVYEQIIELSQQIIGNLNKKTDFDRRSKSVFLLLILYYALLRYILFEPLMKPIKYNKTCIVGQHD